MTNTTTPATPDGLSPCPFCGSNNVKTFGPYGWYHQWGISHSCMSFYNGSSEFFKGFHSEAEAIAAWETRALSTPLADNWLTSELAGHFPSGLRSTRGYLKTGEMFESHIQCECYCGAAFVGTDEQEVRQQWADHIAALRSPMPVKAEGVDALERLDGLERHRFKGDQSKLRMRFNEAIAGGPNMNGDSGPTIHTNGHAFHLEKAIECIWETRALTTKADAAGEGVERAKRILADYTKDAEMRVTLALSALIRTPSQANDAAGKVERAAKAMAADDGSPEQWEDWLNPARAAVRALNTSQGEG